MVSLGENSRGYLSQDALSGQVSGVLGDIGVLDAGLGGGVVFGGGLQDAGCRF